MKKTAVLLGALLLSAAAAPSFAQSSSSDEGRPHLNAGPSASLSRLCRNEARDKKMAGAERRRFMRDCMANRVPPEGSSGASDNSATRSQGATQLDPDGRVEKDPSATSRYSRRPVTKPTSRGGATDTDAEGRPRNNR